jgi:hypothetical protein
VSPDKAARTPAARATYRAVCDIGQLDAAWRHIRGNAHSPTASKETRRAVGEFERDAASQLGRIARQLREERFRFGAQEATPIARPGKTPRPIVVAPVRNRIVQRAILNVLQADPRIRRVLETRHSFGGIQGRGVIDAMREVAVAIDAGHHHYYRSDIRDFFTGIPRTRVVSWVGQVVRDPPLRRVFEAGLEVNLANLDEMTVDERALFPHGNKGVAQGSPLSAFAGNLLLAELDRSANTAETRFIRYMDDLLILARSKEAATHCFAEVRAQLDAMGMLVYAAGESQSKAKQGRVTESFDFLGTQITAGLLQPAKENRAALLQRVELIVSDGERRLRRIAKTGSGPLDGGLARILWKLDNQVRGTARAFGHCDCQQLWRALDAKIDGRIGQLLGLYARLRQKCSGANVRRRLLGVTPLADLNGAAWRALASNQD